MSRPLRIEYGGAWYHVMNRGGARRAVCRGDIDRYGFVSLLAEIHRSFLVEIHAYCLMDNHFHLLVRTRRPNLGEAMRYLGSVYTQRFNRTHEIDGALFRGRYKAILVDAEAYLLAVSRYVHMNPVAAGVVANPAAYPWSSFQAYLQLERSPEWLYVDETLSRFGSGSPRRDYRAFVVSGVDEETERFYSRGRLHPVLGTETFRAAVAREQSPSPGVPDARRISPLDADVVLRTTAQVLGVTVESLRVPRAGSRSPARRIALLMCRERGDLSMRELARLFGLSSEESVDRATSRLRRDGARDEQLARDMARVRAALPAREE